MELVNSSTKKIIKEFGKNDKDSGNAEVQIAMLTKEIMLLTKHIAGNKKDNHSKLGLFKKISHRKKLLVYLKKKDDEKYKKLIAKLNLRK